MDRSPAAGWDAALDAFEHRLDQQLQALERADHAAITPFVPPADLGPMPPELAARARELLGLATALERSVEDTMEAILRGPRRHGPPRRIATPGPRFVDTSA